MKPLLAILIPTLEKRIKLFMRVLDQLDRQRWDQQFKNCIIIYRSDAGELTTGAKRNMLIDEAVESGASHIAFVDDDDLVSPGYLNALMPGVIGDYDCCELYGQYYENGKQMNPFHHSIIHDHWWQDSKFYYRNPNHLNVIALRCLNGIRFQDKTIGEDGHFSIDLQKAGVLKRQYPINEILYYYFSGGKKNHALEPAMALKRGTNL